MFYFYTRGPYNAKGPFSNPHFCYTKMTSALIARAARKCFAHCHRDKVALKARVVAAAFAAVPLDQLEQMSLAHVLAHITDTLPCLCDLGTTADCLARTVMILRDVDDEEDSEDSEERPRTGKRARDATAKKPRPEEPFDLMHGAALCQIARSPATPVST